MPDYAPGLVDGWWNGGCCFQKGHISFSASLVAAAEATLALSELEAGQMLNLSLWLPQSETYQQEFKVQHSESAVTTWGPSSCCLRETFL